MRSRDDFYSRSVWYPIKEEDGGGRLPHVCCSRISNTRDGGNCLYDIIDFLYHRPQEAPDIMQSYLGGSAHGLQIHSRPQKLRKVTTTNTTVSSVTSSPNQWKVWSGGCGWWVVWVLVGGPRRKRHRTSSKIIENLDAEHLETQDHNTAWNFSSVNDQLPCVPTRLHDLPRDSLR